MRGYHGSTKLFKKFRPGKECGLHFAIGDRLTGYQAGLHRIVQTVIHRADIKSPMQYGANKIWMLDKAERALSTIKPIVYEVELDVHHEIRMQEGLRMGSGWSWDSSRILNNLLDPLDPRFVPPQLSGVTEEELDAYEDTISEAEPLNIIPGEDPVDIFEDTEDVICDYVGSFLAYKGFDHIIYDNLFEGGQAVIVFDMYKIQIVGKTLIDKDIIMQSVEASL